MVARVTVCTALLILAAPVWAQSPQDQMFPDGQACYSRAYSEDHLATHPAQRVMEISLAPDFRIAHPLLGLRVELRLRGAQGGDFEGYGYCENEGARTLYCGMEGDAGASR